MELTVQMLGTGTQFARSYYNNNALITCNGYTLLIDCGITATRALHELNVPLKSIDSIYISHIHSDHTGGLEEVGLRSKFELKRTPHLILPAALKGPLWDHSLRGGMEQDGLTSLEHYFQVTELEDRVPATIHPGLTLETVPLRHIPGKLSYGLIINDFLFYSSDTVFERAVLEDLVYRRNISYILHDCQLFHPGIVHTSLQELLTLPEEIQERIMLMHYNDSKPDFIGKTGKMTFLEQHQIYRFARKAESRLS